MTLGKLTNKLKFLIPTLLVVGILAYLFLTDSFSVQPKSSSTQLEKNEAKDLLIPVPYNWPLFYTAIEKQAAKELAAENNDSEIKAPIVAAIAPHHDLAAEYTAELFSKLSNPKIKTVIIVGPNH